MKTKKKIIIAIVITVAVLAAGAFFLNQLMMSTMKASSDSVSTAVVERGDINLKIFGRGVLRPADQYEVKSLVKGEVLSSDFEEGDQVQKGDVLFAISQEEVDGQLTGAEIGVKKNENYLESLESQLSDLKVTSSIKGSITRLDIKKGDTVVNGQIVGEVMDKSRLKLTAYFASEEASKLSGKAKITVSSTSEELKAKIVHISDRKELIDGGIHAVAVKLEAEGNLSSLAGAMATARIGDIEAIKGGILEVGEIGSIVARGSGRVLSVIYEKGDPVSAGSVIAKLDSKELNRQIESARLDIDQAKTSLDDVKRRQKSYAITAPIEGTLIQKNKKVGDVVDPTVDSGSGGLALIYDLSSMKLVLNIDELDVLKIKKGQKVEIEAAALPDETFEAVVENVSMQGKSEAGVTTYPVTVRILKMGNLMPGMNVTGNIHAASMENVLSVPAVCLQRGNKLYVKDSSDTEINTGNMNGIGGPPLGFHEVDVEIGINDGERVEIKSGVKEGDIIFMPSEISADPSGIELSVES